VVHTQADQVREMEVRLCGVRVALVDSVDDLTGIEHYPFSPANAFDSFANVFAINRSSSGW
jgi:hypothetical protein